MPANHPITPKERGLTRREEQTNAAIIAETVSVLEARGDFNRLRFRQYLIEGDALFVPPPDEPMLKRAPGLFESIADKYIDTLTTGRPPKWIHEAAESLAGKFTVWRAGGLQ